MADPRVAFVHHKADEALDLVRSRITCRGPGCAACCRSDVVAHPAEVAELLPHVTDAAWARVDARADMDGSELLASPCALLDPETRLCTVYAHRPGLCRVYAVTGPPEDCDVSRAVREVVRPAVPVMELGLAMDHALPGGHAAGVFLVEVLIRSARRRRGA